MEYDYADQLDLEWQCLLQTHLKSFSCQTENGKLYSYDEVLEKVFCPENEVEQEVNYRDREICEKCITESFQFLSNRLAPPRKSQIHFLLNITKYTSRDETCFINLNANNIHSGLIYLSQPSNVSTDKKTKKLFLELLHSFLEHQSGVKGLIESKYWTYGYGLILDNQKFDEDLANFGYRFLTKLLEKAISLNKDFCYDIIQLIAGPLLNAAHLFESQPQYTAIECFELIEGLRPSILCLIEILEILLEEYNIAVLNYIIQLKIGLASDTVSKTTNDKSMCLVLDRIAILLSFFKLTDILDGIKSISQDPLAVTGFLRIVVTEIDKGAIDLVFELYYYALKYLTHISEKVPKYIRKGKNVDIETEIICLQLEPILLISEKFDYHKLLKSLDTDLVRMSHLTKVLQMLSVNTLKVGQKIKEVLPTYPFEVYIVAVKLIIQSRHLYSKAHLGTCFEGLIFSLQDTVEHIKMRKNIDQAIEAVLQDYVSELLKAILLFIESFNLSWSDSVKILELTQIVNGGCSSYQWPAPIVVQGLKLLQEIISRRLSPTMSLLIDCDEDLKEVGPLLYQKCFTTEWEVRKAVLDVVHTIAVSANNSFPSFKNLLLDVCLPHLISTMALNDKNSEVRAAAFKCLHEIFRMQDMEEILPKNPFINKVLDFLLVSNAPSAVKQEAIKLITVAYLHRDGLEDRVLSRVYKYLEHLALTNLDPNVQIAALDFWCTVIKKHLSNQGWMDKKFPSVTFSKRIVCMTNKEVRKRIYKVLNQLSAIGCLNIFEKISHFENLQSEANTYLNTKLFYFNSLFREHEVTPESMLFNEEYPNLQSISNNVFLAPRNSVDSVDSDEVIQEIINDTVMKMIPDDLEFVHDEDLYTLMESRYSKPIQQAPVQPVPQTSRQITPSEFVDFVYKKVDYLAALKDGIQEYFQEAKAETDDVYNIIDY